MSGATYTHTPHFLLQRQVRRVAFCCLGIHNAAYVQSCPVYRQRNTLIRRRSSTSFGNAVWCVAPWPVTRSADVSAGRWDALIQPETGSCARASAEPADEQRPGPGAGRGGRFRHPPRRPAHLIWQNASIPNDQDETNQCSSGGIGHARVSATASRVE